MKKWKKIQKSLIRKWRQTQCDWFGHQPVTVIEERWRGKQNILNRKGGKPRKGGHYVTGYYEKCARCGKKLSEVDIRFNVNGHSIENGSIRLSYNIYEHSIMVTRVWLNGKETKELVDTIQQWLDNNQDFIK